MGNRQAKRQAKKEPERFDSEKYDRWKKGQAIIARRDRISAGTNDLWNAYMRDEWNRRDMDIIIGRVAEDLPKFDWIDDYGVKWDVHKLIHKTRQVYDVDQDLYKSSIIYLLQGIAFNSNLCGYVENMKDHENLHQASAILEKKLERWYYSEDRVY